MEMSVVRETSATTSAIPATAQPASATATSSAPSASATAFASESAAPSESSTLSAGSSFRYSRHFAINFEDLSGDVRQMHCGHFFPGACIGHL
eukprot:IDg175t1